MPKIFKLSYLQYYAWINSGKKDNDAGKFLVRYGVCRNFNIKVICYGHDAGNGERPFPAELMDIEVGEIRIYKGREMLCVEKHWFRIYLVSTARVIKDY